MLEWCQFYCEAFHLKKANFQRSEPREISLKMALSKKYKFFQRNNISLKLHYFFTIFILSFFLLLFPFLLFSNEEKKKEFFSIFISLWNGRRGGKMGWREGEIKEGKWIVFLFFRNGEKKWKEEIFIRIMIDLRSLKHSY